MRDVDHDNARFELIDLVDSLGTVELDRDKRNCMYWEGKKRKREQEACPSIGMCMEGTVWDGPVKIARSNQEHGLEGGSWRGRKHMTKRSEAHRKLGDTVKAVVVQRQQSTN